MESRFARFCAPHCSNSNRETNEHRTDCVLNATKLVQGFSRDDLNGRTGGFTPQQNENSVGFVWIWEEIGSEFGPFRCVKPGPTFYSYIIDGEEKKQGGFVGRQALAMGTKSPPARREQSRIPAEGG